MGGETRNIAIQLFVLQQCRKTSCKFLLPVLNKDDDDGSQKLAKNEFTFFKTLSRLFRSAQIVKKCGRFFLDFNFFLDCTHVKKGKREFVFVCSRPQSIKRHIRRFHVVVVQWMYVKDVYQKA